MMRRRPLLLAGLLGLAHPVLAHDAPAPTEAPPPVTQGEEANTLTTPVSSEKTPEQAADPTNIDDILEYMKIEVTVASKESESVLDASGTVYVITDEQIKRHGWRNLREVLAAIPNMDLMWQWNWLTGGQRGFTGNFSGSLLLIDGREVQNLLAGEAFINSSFVAHRIKRVEVLQGPNSTLYGPNALEGVINIVTKFGESGTDTKEIWASLGELHDEQVGGVFRQSGEDYAFGFSASYFTAQQNWKRIADFAADTDQFSRDPNFDAIRYRGRSSFQIPEESYSVDAYTRYKDFFAGYNYFRVFNTQGIEFVKFNYTGEESHRSFRTFFMGVNHTFSKEASVKLEYRNVFEEDGSVTRFEPTDLTGVTPQTKLPLTAEDFYDGRRHQILAIGSYNLGDFSHLTLGYDFQAVRLRDALLLDEVRPGQGDTNPGGVEAGYPNANTHSAFIQDTGSFLDNQLKVTVGLRYVAATYYPTDYRNTAKPTPISPSLLPRASVIYHPSTTSAVKFTFGEGYRGPNPWELTFGGRNLPPLKKRMYELNYTQQFSSEGSNVGFVNILAAYLMQAPNVYANVAGGNGNDPRTVASNQETSVSGVEDMLTMSVMNAKILAGFRYALPSTAVIANQTVRPDIPLFKGKLGLSYRFVDLITASIFVDHWSQVKTDAVTRDGNGVEVYTVPAWTTVNLNVLAGDFNLGNMKVTLSGYVENLLDLTYYHANVRGTRPVQYVQAPRNGRIQAIVAF